MMNKPFQPFRRILIKNAVPTLFLPERYVPRPKHHVESFSMDVNTSVEPYTPDVHGSNIDGQVPHDIDKKDFGSQFDTDDGHNCCLDFKNKLKEAQAKIKALELQLKKAKKMTVKNKQHLIKTHLLELGHNETAVKHMLTPNLKFRRNYSEEDVCNGLILKCMSTKSYEYLRRNKIIALPSHRTLSRWLEDVVCSPGHHDFYYTLLERNLQQSEPFEKEGVLMFDEIDIKNCYEYDYTNKQVYGEVKKAQCVIIRGLYSRWKQMIFFYFDTPMTKDLITKIIIKSEGAGIRIRGISFDLGNQTFLRQFGIIQDLNHFMENPADPSRVIYFFPDVPHLIKLFRKIIKIKLNFYICIFSTNLFAVPICYENNEKNGN